MMRREKDIRKPKKGFKLFIIRCGECGNKQMVELKRHQKTIKHACKKCETVNRHKIIGKIRKLYAKWNMMKIRWF